MTPDCPLCEAEHATAVETGDGRRYADCASCGLIHMLPEHHLPADAERTHYETHENDPADARYRAFLSRLADPLCARLPPGATGIDYGAGPGPTLSVMLAERGFPTEIYDPFFAPDPGVLARRYDFVTCSETAEHFHHPRKEFLRLDDLLRPGGLLGVMTVTYDDEPFDSWWYRRDPTHVSLYRERTMLWIARWRGWALETPCPNIALFRKPA